MGVKRPDQLTYDGDTQKVSYGYDELGRVTTRTAECGAVAGKLTSTYTYVDGGFGTNSTTPLVKKITQNGISFEYEYDSRGNIVSEKRGNLTTTYAYDALGQLIRVNDPHENATWVYSYDRGGNILSKTKYAYTTGTVGTALESIPYSYGDANWKDKLTSYNGQTITYDAIGNPLNDGIWTYEWQAGRQLKRMSAEGTVVSFKYDHNGLRTQKIVEQDWYPVTTNYTLHGKLLTHMTVDYTDFDEIAHQDKLHFFYDDQCRPAKVKYNGAMYSYLHNLQGDIIGIVDSDGTLVVEYKYNSWGTLLSRTGSLAGSLGYRNPFRYRGYIYDEETWMYWVKDRYYYPELMRFITADTDAAIRESVGTIADRNIYAYCGNNPIHRVDTTGTFWDTIFDVISLGASIVEVVSNPTDPWAWAGLVGDAIDLIPFVSGVGEVTRAVKTADKIGDAVDGMHDATKAADNIVNSAATARKTAKVHNNSLKATRTNYGYALVDKDNYIMKFGETVNPRRRYTKKYLNEKGYRMRVLVEGSKEEIHYWQYDMNRYYQYKYDKFPPEIKGKGW